MRLQQTFSRGLSVRQSVHRRFGARQNRLNGIIQSLAHTSGLIGGQFGGCILELIACYRGVRKVLDIFLQLRRFIRRRADAQITGFLV